MTWSKIPMHLNHGLIELPKNHGWERVVSLFNVLRTMDGREWFLHLMFLKPWMKESGFHLMFLKPWMGEGGFLI